MDRVRRYYSVEVVPVAPGGIHHPECPCCLFRRDAELACRSAYGMRGAGFSDRTIQAELRREGFSPHVVAVAGQFVGGALDSPPNAHHWVRPEALSSSAVP